MSRRDLLALIAEAARHRKIDWRLERQGANHEIWSIGGRMLVIPRHREIRTPTALAILRDLEEEFGPRWWQR